jgi:hypothetical protein
MMLTRDQVTGETSGDVILVSRLYCSDRHASCEVLLKKEIHSFEDKIIKTENSKHKSGRILHIAYISMGGFVPKNSSVK